MISVEISKAVPGFGGLFGLGDSFLASDAAAMGSGGMVGAAMSGA